MSEAYIESADVTMIVTDCNRAVDSKSGSDLLQRKLEQAFLMDNRGNSDDVIIVCTKADAIDSKSAEREIPELRRTLKPVTAELLVNESRKAELSELVRKIQAKIKSLGSKKDTQVHKTKASLREELEETRDEL